MKKFCFYSKSDSTKESLGSFKYPNKIEAIIGIATLKQLPVDVFQQLFEVIPDER